MPERVPTGVRRLGVIGFIWLYRKKSADRQLDISPAQQDQSGEIFVYSLRILAGKKTIIMKLSYLFL